MKKKIASIFMALAFAVSVFLFPISVYAQPNGIDISAYQGDIDFNAVKSSNINYVLIKATEGTSYIDLPYKMYYNNAKNAGIKVSFYHFFHPANNPITEAQHFLSAINGLKLDCKVAIDIEITQGLNRDQISGNVRQFAEYLKANNVDFCIYTYSSFYNDYLNDSVKGYPHWIANYSHDPKIANEIGWQYSESSYVNGIYGKCDADIFSNGIEVGNNSSTAFTDSNYTPINNSNSIENNIINGKLFLGSRCKELQQKLNQLDYNCGTVDGDFGNLTYSALISFQSKNGLSVDGFAGNATFSKINELINSQSGSQNSDRIRTIQRQLNQVLKCNLVVDGSKGYLTTSQIIKFQRIMGLVQDGSFGSITTNAMNQILSRPVDAVPRPHYEYATRYIQWRVGTGIDGSFGNGTARAVRIWQRNHGLYSDGSVGKNTWSLLLN